MFRDPLHRAIAVISLGLLAGILLSWNLWTSQRAFPLFPLFDLLPAFPSPIDLLVLITFCGLLTALFIKLTRLSFIAILGIGLILALQDQQRWQPWFYQYLLMLLPCAFIDWKRITQEERDSLASTFRLIVIAVYLWGGIHKCHSGFLSVWENSLIAPILEKTNSPFLDTALTAFGYAIPPIEILMAIGLAFQRTRKISIISVVLTHVSILLLLGPAKGYISNSVVWPWNLVMILLVLLLFRQKEASPFAFLKFKKLRYVAFAVALLVLPAPILFHLNAWDRYLSFNLYSGQQKRILVKIEAATLPHVPDSWAPYLLDPQADDGHQILSAAAWTNKELNTPFVSEWRLLRRFAGRIASELPAEPPPTFYVDYRHLPHKTKRFYLVNQIDEMRD